MFVKIQTIYSVLTLNKFNHKGMNCTFLHSGNPFTLLTCRISDRNDIFTNRMPGATVMS